MRRYSMEARTRKGYGFLWFARKYKTQLLDTGLDSLVYKAGELLGNKIADAVTKSNDDEIWNLINIQEMLKK